MCRSQPLLSRPACEPIINVSLHLMIPMSFGARGECMGSETRYLKGRLGNGLCARTRPVGAEVHWMRIGPGRGGAETQLIPGRHGQVA